MAADRTRIFLTWAEWRCCGIYNRTRSLKILGSWFHFNGGQVVNAGHLYIFIKIQDGRRRNTNNLTWAEWRCCGIYNRTRSLKILGSWFHFNGGQVVNAGHLYIFIKIQDGRRRNTNNLTWAEWRCWPPLPLFFVYKFTQSSPFMFGDIPSPTNNATCKSTAHYCIIFIKSS